MDTPANCVCFHLRKAARAVSRVYDEALAETGLRNTQFSLLCVVQGRGPLTVTELADIAVMDRTTLTRNLRLLESQKLVTSEPGEDRRMRVITLTERGRSKLKTALPVWKKTQAGMIDRLGSTRKDRLLRDLDFTARLKD